MTPVVRPAGAVQYRAAVQIDRTAAVLARTCDGVGLCDLLSNSIGSETSGSPQEVSLVVLRAELCLVTPFDSRNAPFQHLHGLTFSRSPVRPPTMAL